PAQGRPTFPTRRSSDLGIYGVMRYTTGQRTHEIGIRIAVGAQRGDVVRLVLRQGMAIVAAGLAIGLAAAFALTRVMRSVLFGVRDRKSTRLNSSHVKIS